MLNTKTLFGVCVGVSVNYSQIFTFSWGSGNLSTTKSKG